MERETWDRTKDVYEENTKNEEEKNKQELNERNHDDESDERNTETWAKRRVKQVGRKLVDDLRSVVRISDVRALSCNQVAPNT